MKIGIDISMLVYQGSGVANYTYNLVKSLLKYDKKNEYRLFYSSLRRPKNFYYLDEFRQLGAKIYNYRFPPFLLKLWWNRWHVVPVEWLIGKVDVFFSSDFLHPPLFPKTKSITTIHDLTWKIYPQFHTEDIVKAHERKLEKTIKYQDIIIVDSQSTKRDLFKYYPQVNRKKVYVVYPAISDHFKKINDSKKITAVIKKYLPDYNPQKQDFVLYVGAIEPRKNLERAIKVFSELIQDKKYSRHRFFIIGRAGWKNEKVFALVDKLKLKDKVVFLGFVEDKDLPHFYNRAKALIYLSKYEGFGLPPLEAAACGTPTLLYANSSLKEIFKTGYPYTKEGREVKYLKNLLNQPTSLKKYTKDFSWKRYVNSFLKVIK